MGWGFIIYVESTIWWCPWKSVHIEDTWVWSTQNCIGIVRHGDSSEDIDAQLREIEDDGEEKHRSGTSIAKLWRQTRENWNRCSGQESKRDYVVLKEEKVFVTGWKKKGSVRRETNVVSGTNVRIVQSRHQKPHHPLSHPCHEVEVCRRKEVSKAKVTMVSFFDHRADIIWRVLARDRLVNIGILPSVNSTKQKRVVKPG